MKTVEVQRPVHIGKVVRNALALGSPRGATGSDSAILDTVDRLFAMLDERKIVYLLVGGVALLHYVEGRNTGDIDLILSPTSLGKLPEIAIKGWEKGAAGAACGVFEGLQIDLLLTSNPLYQSVVRRYGTRRSFVEREISCATVEGLVLLKLYALPALYRKGGLVRAALYETDILSLIHRYQPELEPLFQELAPHVSATDLSALRKLVAEIQARIARFGERF